MSRLAVCLLFFACQQKVPLSEVPIRGGTEEQRALLEAELAAYEDAIGPDRVALRYVELVDEVLGDDFVEGVYRGKKVILLDKDSDSLTRILRHELCHAVDHADHLTRRPDPLLDELSAAVFSQSATLALVWRLSYKTAREQRGEAMSILCELGPLALSALTDPCPEDSLLAREAADWLMREVYREYVPLEPLSLAEAPVVTLEGWDDGASSIVSASTEPGVVIARSDSDFDDWQVAADIETGELLDTTALPVEDIAEAPILRGVYLADVVGFPEGPAAAIGAVLPSPLEGDDERLFVYDREGGDWRMTDDGCGYDHGDLFTADGEVFRSRRDAGLLRWQKLSLP